MMTWAPKPPEVRISRWWVESNAGWCLQNITLLPDPSAFADTHGKYEMNDSSYGIVIQAGSHIGTQTNVMNKHSRAMFWGACSPHSAAIGFCDRCQEAEWWTTMDPVHLFPGKKMHSRCRRAAGFHLLPLAGACGQFHT
jgi:hypothetical protein